jgi:hypothetical protein
MMIKVATLDNLKEMFIQGELEFIPKSITIESENRTYTIQNYLEEQPKKGSWLYMIMSTDTPICVFSSEDGNYLTFEWKREGLKFVPHNISCNNLVCEEELNSVDTEITFIDFDMTLKGKVDTGADMCSIHLPNARFIKTRENDDLPSHVVWENQNGDRFIIPVVDKIVIRRANDEETRYIIKCNVEWMGEKYSGVDFNIADRSNLEFPVLIGLNLLKQSNVTINLSEQDEMLKSVMVELQDEKDTNSD